MRRKQIQLEEALTIGNTIFPAGMVLEIDKLSPEWQKLVLEALNVADKPSEGEEAVEDPGRRDG